MKYIMKKDKHLTKWRTKNMKTFSIVIMEYIEAVNEQQAKDQIIKKILEDKIYWSINQIEE